MTQKRPANGPQKAVLCDMRVVEMTDAIFWPLCVSLTTFCDIYVDMG